MHELILADFSINEVRSYNNKLAKEDSIILKTDPLEV